MSELHHLQDLLPHTKYEIVTDAAATVAIASPWWLPLLKETSEIASFLLPIFGVVWLSVQIGLKLWLFHKSKN